MKQIFTKYLLLLTIISGANAQDRYEDLTYDYFYAKGSTVSLAVKLIIAQDIHTSSKVLNILTHDKNLAVWLLANDNLNNSI